MENKNNAVVIGAGFSGLAAAATLAREGFKVKVLEKNSTAGGRARKFSAEGFMFDMGPSWYWMPDVFDSFFARFGKKTSDYYDLVRLDPSYTMYFGRDEAIDLPADMQSLFALFEKLEPGSSKALQKFLDEGEYKYRIGINRLVYKPGESLTEFMDAEVIKGIFKLHLFSDFDKYIRRFFKNPRLLTILEFPVLFLGGIASQTPALYSLMNYGEMKLGTWYPMGGMTRIIEGMQALCAELGVEFRFDEEVTEILIRDGRVTSVRTVNGEVPADYLIASADYNHVEQQLLPPENRRYSASYWDSRVLSPSSLIYYLGINKTVPFLRHHNLFFDVDFPKHASEIYDLPQWPENPAFYVSCPSRTDPSVAPAGMENLFVLIPVAPGLNDNEGIREKYFEMIVSKLEAYSGENIRNHIVYKRTYAHRDFISDYHAYKGNAYGLANTLLQTAILKPKMRAKKLKNMVFTGQLTVPGPGIPPALISGQVAAGLISRSANN